MASPTLTLSSGLTVSGNATCWTAVANPDAGRTPDTLAPVMPDIPPAVARPETWTDVANPEAGSNPETFPATTPPEAIRTPETDAPVKLPDKAG